MFFLVLRPQAFFGRSPKRERMEILPFGNVSRVRRRVEIPELALTT